jgi:two-component system, OmpR family, sensor histidine kinase BaeS
MTSPRMTGPRIAGHASSAPLGRPGLAARLLTAQLVVVVAGALTLGLVAVTVAPRLFTVHLDRAGEANPVVRAHAEEAFGYALGIALVVAALVSVLTALVVSGFVVRRLTAPVVQLARTADELAAGNYRVAIPDARLGGEFDRLTAAFGHMADRLGRTESVRQGLLSDLAHELRTPLSTLSAHVDGIEDGVLDAVPATWQVMRDQLDRLQRLAGDLTRLSAAEEHALSLDLRPTDLSRVAFEAVEAAGPAHWAKRLTLVLDAPAPVPALADAVRMQQVLANLLDNALRHTPPDGVVRVGVHQDGAEALVTVSDTGPGIPASELESVFDRFYRVGPARSREDGGSGLGLTIARAIVVGQGGTLTATSAPRDGASGQGATFTLRMPARATPYRTS